VLCCSAVISTVGCTMPDGAAPPWVESICNGVAGAIQKLVEAAVLRVVL
jgi:hypothetical protein